MVWYSGEWCVHVLLLTDGGARGGAALDSDVVRRGTCSCWSAGKFSKSCWVARLGLSPWGGAVCFTSLLVSLEAVPGKFRSESWSLPSGSSCEAWVSSFRATPPRAVLSVSLPLSRPRRCWCPPSHLDSIYLPWSPSGKRWTVSDFTCAVPGRVLASRNLAASGLKPLLLRKTSTSGSGKQTLSSPKGRSRARPERRGRRLEPKRL